MIDPASLRRRAVPIDRSSDRRSALASIAVAVGFLVAALASVALPEGARRGAWLPIHLALAGGASTAIAGVMPFFVAAFAAAAPGDARVRSAAVACVAAGAAVLSLGWARDAGSLAALGGLVFLAGVALTAAATVRPLGRALGPSRGLITRSYLVALAMVAAGAVLGIGALAGWPPLLDLWTRLRPAHAWLNLVGFVSLVIATTLLHFFPTVVGARIVPGPSAKLTVIGLAGGTLAVAAGFAVGSDWLVRAGAIGVLTGALSLARYCWRTWRTRAGWTTDRDWHRFAIGGLVSSVAWFEIGVLVATGRLLVFGAGPGAWLAEASVGPLVAGWVGMALLASATHLVPAVGPGGPEEHARQRRLLGRGALLRLVLLDAGILAASIALPLGLPGVAAAGLLLATTGLLATVVLLAAAIGIGLRHQRPT